MLKSQSVSYRESFSEECEMVPSSISLHLILKFERLHNFHFGISKLVKDCRIRSLPLNSLRMNPDILESQTTLLFSMQLAVL